MKLTGLALDAFKERHYNSKNQFSLNNIPFDELPETCQNALIIEFLNTLQYKDVPLFDYCFEFFWKHRIKSQSFNDICDQAIEKANEIFNLNNK